MDYEVSKEELENGLKVITEPRPEREITALYLSVDSGSLQQEKENQGIIHLIEHLLMNGSENFPGQRGASEEIRKEDRSNRNR